jgi:DNA polymerase V
LAGKFLLFAHAQESTMPLNQQHSIVGHALDHRTRCDDLQPTGGHRPLFNSRVAAGFPSPASDYIESTLDLNDFLIQHPSATFFVRVAGDSMLEAGIFDGDYLIVDRAIEPTNGAIVIAVLDDELTVKRFFRGRNSIELRPENQSYQPIRVSGDAELLIWGVVISVFRKLS